MNESTLRDEEKARDALHFLIHKLEIVPTGPLNETQQSETLAILREHWDNIAGANETSMTAFKLDRAIAVQWHHGERTLSFEIERHGATVKGSSRAARQQWVVDLINCTAQQSVDGYNQLRPRDKSFLTAPAVAKIVALVKAGPETPTPDGAGWKDGALRIQPSVLFGLVSDSKQTQTNRTRNLRIATGKELTLLGWKIDSSGGGWSIKRQ